MYQVVCTKTLANADDVSVKVLDYTDKKDAVACFNEKLYSILKEAVDNEFLNVKMSMHGHRALVRFESTHYLVAIVQDGGLLSSKSN